ncbi:hypothetical protein [Phaffia rhodozyma]|uniref:Uncharacterized protein n=1 Tax=Phaffia rhodozyma TaxID=264483 RepID=A0A0F7SXG0_PHARH|nr:hypothetical protein [Phaffia rhodozyma]
MSSAYFETPDVIEPNGADDEWQPPPFNFSKFSLSADDPVSEEDPFQSFITGQLQPVRSPTSKFTSPFLPTFNSEGSIGDHSISTGRVFSPVQFSSGGSDSVDSQDISPRTSVWFPDSPRNRGTREEDKFEPEASLFTKQDQEEEENQEMKEDQDQDVGSLSFASSELDGMPDQDGSFRSSGSTSPQGRASFPQLPSQIHLQLRLEEASRSSLTFPSSSTSPTIHTDIPGQPSPLPRSDSPPPLCLSIDQARLRSHSLPPNHSFSESSSSILTPAPSFVVNTFTNSTDHPRSIQRRPSEISASSPALSALANSPGTSSPLSKNLNSKLAVPTSNSGNLTPLRSPILRPTNFWRHTSRSALHSPLSSPSSLVLRRSSLINTGAARIKGQGKVERTRGQVGVRVGGKAFEGSKLSSILLITIHCISTTTATITMHGTPQALVDTSPAPVPGAGLPLSSPTLTPVPLAGPVMSTIDWWPYHSTSTTDDPATLLPTTTPTSDTTPPETMPSSVIEILSTELNSMMVGSSSQQIASSKTGESSETPSQTGKGEEKGEDKGSSFHLYYLTPVFVAIGLVKIYTLYRCCIRSRRPGLDEEQGEDEYPGLRESYHPVHPGPFGSRYESTRPASELYLSKSEKALDEWDDESDYDGVEMRYEYGGGIVGMPVGTPSVYEDLGVLNGPLSTPGSRYSTWQSKVTVADGGGYVLRPSKEKKKKKTYGLLGNFKGEPVEGGRESFMREVSLSAASALNGIKRGTLGRRVSSGHARLASDESFGTTQPHKDQPDIATLPSSDVSNSPNKTRFGPRAQTRLPKTVSGPIEASPSNAASILSPPLQPHLFFTGLQPTAPLAFMQRPVSQQKIPPRDSFNSTHTSFTALPQKTLRSVHRAGGSSSTRSSPRQQDNPPLSPMNLAGSITPVDSTPKESRRSLLIHKLDRSKTDRSSYTTRTRSSAYSDEEENDDEGEEEGEPMPTRSRIRRQVHAILSAGRHPREEKDFDRSKSKSISSSEPRTKIGKNENGRRGEREEEETDADAEVEDEDLEKITFIPDGSKPSRQVRGYQLRDEVIPLE